jgi:hypothetical protein
MSVSHADRKNCFVLWSLYASQNWFECCKGNCFSKQFSGCFVYNIVSCSEGLTAVNSSEILDIMYSDFQQKYEEYRRFMRDRQAKEFTTKQKGTDSFCRSF